MGQAEFSEISSPLPSLKVYQMIPLWDRSISLDSTFKTKSQHFSEDDTSQVFMKEKNLNNLL